MTVPAILRLAVLGLAALPVRALKRQRLEVVEHSSPTTKHKFQTVLTNKDGKGMEYIADMIIGGQVVKSILDTGSFELLVFSSHCHTCGNISRYYNSSRSSSHVPSHLTTEHSLGEGTTKSRLAYEKVGIGLFQTDRQYFWEVTSASIKTGHKAGYQAIVGVGPPSTPRLESMDQAQRASRTTDSLKTSQLFSSSQMQDVMTEEMKLAKESTVLENFGVLRFSVCIGRPSGSDGYFTWNDDDPRQMTPGLFRAVPVAGNSTWGVLLAQVRLEPKNGGPGVLIGCEDSCGAIFDSGSSLIVVPSSVAAIAAEEIERLHTDCSNLDELPHLTFELAGERFTLPPQAYVGQVTGVLPKHMRRLKRGEKVPKNRACELLLMTMDVTSQIGDLFIFGLPFFREYYTTFDLGENIWDEQHRSLFMAHSDGFCHPEMPPEAIKSTPSSLIQQSAHSVDLSKVQLPGLARSAASGRGAFRRI